MPYHLLFRNDDYFAEENLRIENKTIKILAIPEGGTLPTSVYNFYDNLPCGGGYASISPLQKKKN